MSQDFAKRGDDVLSPVLGHFTRRNIERGEGAYFIETDGNRILDFSAGIATASTGHCHPDVVAAIHDQSSKLIHGCAGVVYYEPNVALAERLGHILGHELNSVFFTQSGTEAIEAAIKLAKYVSKKSRILAFKGGFHGRSMGALSITTSKDKYWEGYAPLLDILELFPYPYEYRNPWADDDQSFEAAAISHLEAYFDTLSDDVAAAIIEPVLGEGGYIPAPTSFLKRLRELCTEKGILLIFDEIQTGAGRTGSWFNFQSHGVSPDIITVAKGIASGMPLGACVSRPDLMSEWSTGAHGGTYGGNPVCCAAGLASLKVIETCLDSVSRNGEHMLTRLRSELSDHPNVGDIRGQGYMIGIEFVLDKTEKTPAPDLIQTVMTRSLDHNLLVVSCGLHNNVIRLMPALTISEDDLNKGLDILIDVIKGL